MRSRTDTTRPGAAATLVELARAEQRLRWSNDRVSQVQLARVRETVARARMAPFYRRLLPSDPDLRSLEDLSTLPLTERKDLASVPIEERRAAAPGPRTLVKHTSGTTGQYLTVELDEWAAWWQGLLALRRNRVRGVQPWQRTAALRIGIDTRPAHGLLDRFARRAVVLDATGDPAHLAEALRRWDPVAISGFGHTLLEVAAHLGTDFRPAVVGTGGQMLSPHDLERLRQRFGVAPLDLYGSVEVGSIGWQCPAADLYHLDHDSVVVEVVDDDGTPVPTGDDGQVAITTLTNSLMPLVRYRLGDVARMASRPCLCGWDLPALETLSGRIEDEFVDERGGLVSASRLFLSGYRDDVTRWVDRYRICQDQSRAVTIEIVPVSPLPADFVDGLEGEFGRVLGAGLPVTVKAVDDLPLEASGKLRQFVSQARPPSGSSVGPAT